MDMYGYGTTEQGNYLSTYVFSPFFPFFFYFFFSWLDRDEICGNADEMPTSEECGGARTTLPPRDVSNSESTKM